MMSGAAIRELQLEAAERAAENNEVPFIVWPEDITSLKGGRKLPFPFLGDYVPRGWKRTDRELLFVDSSGFGEPGEPALTVNQFIDSLTPGKGYAVVEAGQFQVYVGEFEKVKGKRG